MAQKKGYTFRKLMNDLHLWLGIASALVLFVVCLTGTIYTFRSEIEQIMEPNKYTLQDVEVVPYDLDVVKDFVEAAANGKVQRVSISNSEKKPLVFSIVPSDGKGRGDNYYVDPYKLEVVGAGKSPSSEFFMTVFKLHRWLLLDSKIGRPIVGWATIIFVILSISGLILWLPKKIKGWKSFKPGFKVKYKANWKRVNHDLHNTLGFYTLLFVLIMALTGLCWSFDWYRDGLSKVLGTTVFGGRNEVKPESAYSEGAATISFSEVLALTKENLNYEGRSTSISYPKDEKGIFEINKNDQARFNETVYDRLFIDQYSGAIIKKELFVDKNVGEKIAAQIRALHFGDIYGLFSKVIYFIVCLIATSLPITGIFIWLNKMKKKPNKTKTK